VDDTTLGEQAKAIGSLMPALMRQLFAMENDPADELPLAQLRVCVFLYEGPRSMSALSRGLGVSLSAMTQLADRLERAGLVTRVAEESDRRVRHLQLTRHGERILRFREQARVQRVLSVLEHLSPETRREVLAALETLLDACAQVHRTETATEPIVER
jgi:DNA-binding MarR family transcriptional regulator